MKVLKMFVFILVLLVMASVLLPSWKSDSPFARETVTRVRLSELMNALDGFRNDVGRYPSTQEGLLALYERPASDGDRWQGPYLSRSVGADPWGNDYQYACPGRHHENGFDVWSLGPDAKDDTEDDIGSWEMGLPALGTHPRE